MISLTSKIKEDKDSGFLSPPDSVGDILVNKVVRKVVDF